MDDALLEIRKKHGNINQVSEEIYQTLSEAMVEDVLHSGDRVVEGAIATLFDVSRTPVREAIKRLEYEGLITYDSRYGFQVKSFSIDECYEVMEALEYIHQITAVAAAGSINRISIMRLRDSIAKSRAILRSDTLQHVELALILEDFHVIIVQSINNASLLQLYRQLHQKYVFILNRYALKNPDLSALENAIEQHQKICDAVEANDKDTVWMLEFAHSSNTLTMRSKRFIF